MNITQAGMSVPRYGPRLSHAAVGLLLYSCLVGSVSAQSLSPATATKAAATDLFADSSKAAVSISVTRDFGFGTLAVSGAGTATVTPAGVLTTTGGVISAGGLPQGALIALKGHPGDAYTLMLPSAVTLLNPTGDALVLRDFSFSPNAAGYLSSAKKDIAVGGTLQLASRQAAGAYRGNIDIIVTYD